MPITLNGSGTVSGISAGGLPDGIIQSADLATGVGGKILQVLQTIKTDVFSTTSTSYVSVTGLTQAITAASTSNKILINVTLYGGCSGANNVAGFKLAKDSTAMDGNTIGAASGNNAQSGTFRFRTEAETQAEETSFMFLDTPADIPDTVPDPFNVIGIIYTIVQFSPVPIVTATPLLIVTGPADIAL